MTGGCHAPECCTRAARVLAACLPSTLHSGLVRRPRALARALTARPHPVPCARSDLDLFVANQNQDESTVIENALPGNFESYTYGSIVDGTAASTDAAWADIDGDGDLGA